ncbi:MAG: YigZ family protein [Bacteroidaceae bacterium]|nr:YigZ family protein [Bacteroidaceae bacterium]
MTDEYKTISGTSEGAYSELRSKFLAFAHPVTTVEEAMAVVEQYQKKFYDARHVCWAYMLGPEREVFRSNDNGEPSGTAGKPILGQINSFGLTDVVVMVVRYFGGVKLGTSGLIVAYRTAAAEALSNASIVVRTVDEDYTFSFEYPFMTAVMKVVREMDARIVSQTYDMDCSMTVSLRKGKMDELKEKVRKALSPF